jgi:hypothetical protein
LVVDGLDEDLHPRGSPSVAALLPTVAGGRAHVLVSSRRYPELPSDVPGGHPLLSTRQMKLEPFAGAAELAALARQEIGELKRRGDDGLATDVLAVLTAAAGPLAIEDLAALTADAVDVGPAHTRGVRRLVTEDAARSLEPVGAVTTRRYQFAHTSLLEYAQKDQDLTDPEYRHRIHRWAAEWASAGWQAGSESSAATPRYLLEAYPATLAGDSRHPARGEDLERLAELVSDLGWVDSAVARIGVDAVLASLRTASQLIPAQCSVAVMLQLLELQAHHLRHPSPVNQPGYGLTALAWEALRLGASALVRDAARRLESYPATQLIPVRTTEHTSRHLVRVVGAPPSGLVGMAGDGRVILVGFDGVIRLWDRDAPDAPSRELGRHGSGVAAFAAANDGRVISGGVDGVVRLWDPAEPNGPGRELGRHEYETPAVAAGVGNRAAGVRAVATTPDGRVISAGDDGAVRLWDPAKPDDPGRELGGRPLSGVLAVGVADQQGVHRE